MIGFQTDPQYVARAEILKICWKDLLRFFWLQQFFLFLMCCSNMCLLIFFFSGLLVLFWSFGRFVGFRIHPNRPGELDGLDLLGGGNGVEHILRGDGFEKTMQLTFKVKTHPLSVMFFEHVYDI